MSFNLDIHKYSIPELLDVIGISNKSRPFISKDLLRTSVLNLMDEVGCKDFKVNGFLKECYGKLCDHYNLSYSIEDLLVKHVNHVGDHQIKLHNDNNSHLAHNLRFKQGRINPLLRQTFLQEININTLFRPNYATSSAADYQFTMPNPVKNVVSMRLSSFEMPCCIYAISAASKSNEFTVHAYNYGNNSIIQDFTPTTFVLPDGNYTGAELVAYINTNFFNIAPYDRINAEFDPTTKRITFKPRSTASSNEFYDIDFGLSANQGRPYQLNLGWMIGFRQPTYASINVGDDFSNANRVFTAESCYSECYSKYMLLQVNDFNNNHNIIMDTPYQQGMIRSTELLGKIPVCSDCESITPCCKNMKKREYFGPVNIDRLHVRLYDQFGNIIDLNNSDYSFSLEVECLYDL
jgi:hypothetical protein